MRSFFLCLLVASCSFGACSKKKCDYRDDQVVAPQAEQQAVKKYLDSAGITATLHSRGFYYKIDTLGSGNTPVPCSEIKVSYSGTLTNGTIFSPQSVFDTELSNLIDGWLLGVPLIKKGGAIWLYIPPSLGYGSQPVGTIPASSILIFNIHLLDVQ